ncbi:hypothetical protein H5410_013516 [Solanum commersonii]|uniref:Uncharacterized protein n=1 Tax=Solanum commersonii TaxID=4109 RepID=A0A9J5ZNL0_SOLCO|nr:hypothetical protein H5410_013516 [Solanum commersonii]
MQLHGPSQSICKSFIKFSLNSFTSNAFMLLEKPISGDSLSKHITTVPTYFNIQRTPQADKEPIFKEDLQVWQASTGMARASPVNLLRPPDQSHRRRYEETNKTHHGSSSNSSYSSTNSRNT